MEPVLIIDELGPEAASASGRDLARSVEAARLVGFRTFSVPVELPRGGEPRDVLSNLAPGRGAPALFSGFIPLRERYEQLAAALIEKGYRVVVSPAAHQQVLELAASVAVLRELTTPMAVINDASRALEVVKSLGFPLFLKGAVQSLKHEGVDACVARDEAALLRVVQLLLRRSAHSRGRVIARPLLKLRHVRTTPNGFPAGREYRAVVFDGEVVGLAPYWDGVDALTALSAAEAAQVHALVLEAASRFDSPLVGVDVGQAEDGRWWVIETNDPQFMGLSQLAPLTLWNRLFRALHPHAA